MEPPIAGKMSPSWFRAPVRFFAKMVVRTMYRVKAFNKERMPLTGPVLLLANHTSYADAMILGSICPRNARFVMFDTLYDAKSLNWFYKLFDTVPISRTKAKEAIRTVAGALKEQQAVALYPEGQLTRTGFLNEIRRGYELMARMGGDAKVQPAWIDGLWGSIFSFEGGRFFNKVPKAFPYSVTVWFGQPIPASDATPERVREAMMDLGAEAFAARKRVAAVPRLHTAGGSAIPYDAARILHLNALRILETSLLHEGDEILCLLPPEHPVTRTFTLALPALRDMRVITELGQIARRDGHRLVAVGDTKTLSEAGKEVWDMAINVQAAEQPVPASVQGLVAGFDPATGALLTLSLPDPVMPVGEEGAQFGRKDGSIGHLLPGLTVRHEGTSLVIGSVLPGTNTAVRLLGVKMDAEGFLFPAA
jgi:acyl-[acyl-carrier-protein]-phospholipid O-acyltransferase/long-chain-fatty-acid--[acyl-carrier-protein] ligase